MPWRGAMAKVFSNGDCIEAAIATAKETIADRNKVLKQVQQTMASIARSRELLSRLELHLEKLDPGAGLGKPDRQAR